MLNYGIPHSLITIAQLTIPSSLVVITQPFTSLFQFFLANCCLEDESFTWKNFSTQMLAIIGSLISSYPNFSDVNFNDSSKFNIFHYIFLISALLSFAFGSIYIKKYLKNSNSELMSAFQLLGASIYAIGFSILDCGSPEKFIASISASGINRIWYPAVLGIAFTMTATFLSVHCIKSLGATIAGFANYGQIIVGVIIGVIFMHEWDNYSTNDYIFATTGLIVLIASMIIGVVSKIRDPDEENVKEELLLENDQVTSIDNTLMNEEKNYTYVDPKSN